MITNWDSVYGECILFKSHAIHEAKCRTELQTWMSDPTQYHRHMHSTLDSNIVLKFRLRDYLHGIIINCCFEGRRSGCCRLLTVAKQWTRDTKRAVIVATATYSRFRLYWMQWLLCSRDYVSQYESHFHRGRRCVFISIEHRQSTMHTILTILRGFELSLGYEYKCNSHGTVSSVHSCKRCWNN